MKVILINGSPRKDGNTFTALSAAAAELAKENIETEIIHIGAELLHGCIGCGYCREHKQNLCVFGTDLVNEVSLKMREADGFIIGSPVYYSGIAGTMKSFLDRVFFSSSAYFRLKPAAALCAVRRSGGSSTFHQLNNYLNLAGTVIAPGMYWNVVHGRTPGEAEKDEEGLQTVRATAKNMAWLLKVFADAKTPRPVPEKKISTNFIR